MSTIIWLDPLTGASAESATFTVGTDDIVSPAPTLCPAGTTYTAYGDRAANVRVYGPVVPTTARTLLRQRQSPVRTPSRVRGIDLRNRQTPFVT